ncbi:hypothetical protein CGLO_10479 [Colletotrichum gloeosporioides Cg-14]|uniref:Uncharacterized protein n=1 Tax=Colletotrichum gloeosporioides (strain Cg-14) TaxID=1237896 RepID=T0LEW4_COLGC|nr:hypothetical protein CGLO_10479 [Colletotrichum gloeosporioides Cg-14]
MAEILGLAASIFAVVQVADRVISLCKQYMECVQDAPSDLQTILVETSTLKAILENIEFLIECDNGQSAIFDSLGGTSGPIQGCHEAMKSLEALFSTGNAPSQGPTSSVKDRARTAFANLTWPLKESKARKLMEDVARYKGTLVLALTADSAAIERELECFDEVYVTVDAIDESNPREDLLKVIRQLATEKRFNKIRLLLTSREYVDIEVVMIEFSMSISMKNEFLDADIRLYTESRLKTEKHIKSWPAELRQETVEALSHGAQGMFRWVVCQIDVLRRIRRRDAIREALCRLPKTLNEAYDRLFGQIEDEDVPYVNSAMKWLCFEAKLNGEDTNVDIQMLAQAVDEDILGDNLEDERLPYDTENLREICGCLITVTPTTLKNGHLQRSVSFAHYTVLEYLASKNRRNPDPFFALDGDGLVLNQAERIFARALCVSDDEFEEYKAVTSPEDENEMSIFPNFGSYCAFTSIDIIIYFDEILSKDNALLCRILEVLDSEKHYYFPLFYIWHCKAGAAKNAGYVRYDDGFSGFETIKWGNTPDLEIRVLVRLLLFGCLHISRVLLERMEPQQAFQAHLDFVYYVFYLRKGSTEFGGHFRGTLTDCFAALYPAASTPSPFSDIDVLKLLIEAGAGNFNPQGALIHFIPLHKHDYRCKGWCVLEKLLSLGADPDASGCYVTPLQIAVANFDVEGVLALLQAGADPNAEGCAAASAWPEDTLLSEFNTLNGWRPVQICRSIRDHEMLADLRLWSIGRHDEDGKKAEQSSIEAILLEYGAED